MKDTAHKFTIGVLGPTTGIMVSLTGVEVWLRVLSLVVGIAVGVASFISIGFSIRRKYRAWKNERLNNQLDDEEPTTTV